MILKGPADADHYRVKVGRYGDRWYADPLAADEAYSATEDAWPSVSTVKKAASSDWSFVALKRVALAKIDDLPALDTSERYGRLKLINQNGLKRAQDRGNNVHAFFEHELRGEPWPKQNPMFPDGDNYRDAVRSFFDLWQPELVACEMVCIDRDMHGYGYGGTTDAVVKINGGTYWVDWKSRGEDSEHGAYPEEAAQIAAYARAQYAIIEGDDGPKRITPPTVDGGLIVSIKPDGCRLYPIELDKAYEHWVAMHAFWAAKRSERDAIGKPWAPKARAAEPAAPRGGATWCPPVGNTEPFDEGPDVDKDAYDALERAYGRLTSEQTVLVNKWITATKTDGGRRLSVRQRPSLWRWTVVRALIKIARLYPDDEIVRWMLYGATHALHCLTPSIPLGTLIASLTADQAGVLANLADRINDGTIAVTFDGGGLPQFDTAA